MKETSYDEINRGYMNNLVMNSGYWHPHTLVGMPLFAHFFIFARRRGSCSFRHHHYQYFALELLTQGSITYEFDGKQYHVNAGEVFLIHRHCDSGFHTTDKSYYEKIVLCFSGLMLDLLIETLQLKQCLRVKLRNPDVVEHEFRQIANLIETKEAGTERLVAEKSYGLLLYLAEESHKSNHILPEPLRKALAFLDDHFHENMKLPDICIAAGVSPATLRTLFQQHFNKTPNEYLINIRMEFAKNLLLSTSMSLKEIAYRIGYNSPFYFSTAFRKFTGVSPRQFRANLNSAGM